MSDIVKFLMPDGSEVSNDPRWQMENGVNARTALVNSQPYTGDEGIPDAEMEAQTGVGLHPLQSGQPGVGSNPAPEDFGVGPNGIFVQTQDAEVARANGNTPTDPAFTQEVPDSNQAVADVREAAAKRSEAAKKAADKLAEAGEEVGDPEADKKDWTAKQLKAEALRRNAEYSEEDQLDLSGVTKKGQLVDILVADDERLAETEDDGSSDDES